MGVRERLRNKVSVPIQSESSQDATKQAQNVVTSTQKPVVVTLSDSDKSTPTLKETDRQAREASTTKVPPMAKLYTPTQQTLPYVQIKRENHARFAKGHSGNPKGRPPSFQEYVRLMTDDGRELVDHALECLRGWVTVKWHDELGNELTKRLPADPRYQAEARAWLAERGYGKAPQMVVVDKPSEQEEDLSALSTDELREYLRLQGKIHGAQKALGEPIEDAVLVTDIVEAQAAQAGGRESEDTPDTVVVSPAIPQL